MKRAAFLLLVALGVSSGAAFAQTGCQTYCDSAWNSCKSVCKSGEEGRVCKNQCAEEHENCLNSCKKQARLDIQRNTFAYRSLERFALPAQPLFSER
jgi:hypothetical protein